MKRTRIFSLVFLLAIPFLGIAQPKLHIIESPDRLHCNDSVLVWSPAGLDNVRDLPVLFLLHGHSGCYRDWDKHTDIQAVSNKFSFRIICPDGFYDSWYINNADPAKMQWRDFFWEELWPEMQKSYGLLSDRTYITGLSMGGHGAMNIFLDHPDRFKGAGSMSGVLALRYSGGSKTTIPPMLGAKDIYDPICEAQGAIARLDRVNEVCGSEAWDKLIVVTCGAQDKTFVPAAFEFAQRCQDLGLRYISTISPARHRWPYWVWVLDYHLDWFKQDFQGGQLGYSK